MPLSRTWILTLLCRVAVTTAVSAMETPRLAFSSRTICVFLTALLEPLDLLASLALETGTGAPSPFPRALM